MKLKIEIQAAVGDAGNQLEASFAVLNGSELTAAQRFHLRQIEQTLFSEGALPEEDEP